MATVLLPEKNILPIKDIEQSAIHPADESILKLIQGGTTVPYSPKPKADDTHRRTKRHAIVGGDYYNEPEPIVGNAYGGKVEPPSADQEIKFPTMIKQLKIKGWFFLPAREFYILYADNPGCWRWTNYNFFEAADLLQSDSIELKGVIGKEQFEAGKRYVVEFLIKMDGNAELNTKSRFTAVLPEPEDRCSIHSTLVNLKEQVKPNEWTFVNVGDFIATENGEHIRFSLTNFDQYWKKGLTVAGVLVHPSTIA